MAAADFFDRVQEIYIAYYQRPADPAGLRFWAGRLEENGGNLNAIIDAFGTSPEAISLYGNVTSQNIGEVIDSIYNGLFGRDADAGGKAFYTEKFLRGEFSPADIALRVLDGAKGDDAAGIENKLMAANDFTQVVDGRALDDPDFGTGGISQFAVSYSGAADAQAARDFLAPITSDPDTKPSSSETVVYINDEIADNPGERQVLTLKEAYITLTSESPDVVTVIPGESSSEVIITTLDPIVTRANYWISSENGEGLPLDEFYNILETELFGTLAETTFANIQTIFGTFNGSLEQIANIAIASSEDEVQGEEVLGGGTGGTGGTGGQGGNANDGASGDGGAGGAGGAGAEGGDATQAVDEFKEGDLTGNYDLTVSLTDGTAYTAVLELSEAQLAFITNMLFDADGNIRFEEREVEVYSYMPLLARYPEGHPSEGELIPYSSTIDASAPDVNANINGFLAQVDVDGQLIPVKAYDIRVVTTTEDDTIEVEEGETVTTQVLTPIFLTTTVNNDATVEPGLPTTKALADVIVAGRLELLHQAYIDAGQGYNILEVDAKGVYAQPLGLVNIREVRIENLPNVYTTAEGAGGGYLGNSTYPGLANVSAPLFTGISANQFTGASGDPSATGTITITSLTVRYEGNSAVAVPAGEYTAQQLVDTVNLIAGAQIAYLGADAPDYDDVEFADNSVVFSTEQVDTAYFGGSQASALGLQNISRTEELPTESASVLDLSRALDLERIVVTEGNNPLSDTPLGALTVLGIRNDAVVSIEGGFTQPVTLDFSAGMNPDVPLTVELNLGELTVGGDTDVAPVVNIASNSNTLKLVSLGGGTNAIDFGDLGNTLSEVQIEGNSRLDIRGNFAASFAPETLVTIDASENTGGTLMRLEGITSLQYAGSEGDDYLRAITTNADDREFVNIVDEMGNNAFDVVTGVATITTGDGDNDFAVTTVGDTTINAGNGDIEIDFDAGRDFILTMGDGDLNSDFDEDVDLEAGRDIRITKGAGDVTLPDLDAGRHATLMFGDGDVQVDVEAEVDITATMGDGDTAISASANRDITITAGSGRSLFVVDQDEGDQGIPENVSITTVDGLHQFRVESAESLQIVTGEGDKEFSLGNTPATDFSGGTFATPVGVAVVSAGGGNNYLEAGATALGLQFGDGDSFVASRAVVFDGTFGDGDNSINVRAFDAPQNPLWETEDYVDTSVNVVVGDGSNTINVAVDNDTLVPVSLPSQMGGDGHYLKPAVVNITAGNGGNDISVPYDVFSGRTIAEVLNGRDPFDDAGSLPLVEVNVTTGDGNDRIMVSGTELNVSSGGGNDDITVIGIDIDYTGYGMESGGDGALINIDAGAGSSVVRLGAAVDESFLISGTITAKEGSSITGEDVTLFVNTMADLRAATLSGITAVELDDDALAYAASPTANNNFNPDLPISSSNTFAAPMVSMLTITDTQFVDLGAANFSVQGAAFDTYARVKIIVTESTSLTDLGVDDLPRNIDLVLELKDGVVLEMTAQQLHERVAPQGVTLADDGTTDLLSGSVKILGGGSDFDPFNIADTVRTEIDGRTYIGGSLSSDFLVGGDWFNVDLQSVFGGYDRPQDAEVIRLLTIDADLLAGAPVEDLTTFHTWVQVVGNEDVNFADPIKLGEDSTGDLPFVLDFSELQGEVVDLVVDNFERLAQGGGLVGNSLEGFEAEVLISIAADDGFPGANASSIGFGWDEPDTIMIDDPAFTGPGTPPQIEVPNPNAPSGLVSEGVARLIVTQIDGSTTRPASVANIATIRLCDETQDLDVFGFRGNWNDTLNLLDVSWDTTIELQGGSTRKADGPQATANVGQLDLNYQWAGAPAEINLVHSVAGNTRDIRVFGLNVENASELNITAEESGAIFDYIRTDDADSYLFTVAGDLVVSETISLNVSGVEEIDASAVTGDVDMSLSGHANPGAFAFTAGAGTTTLTLEAVDTTVHSSFEAEDAATFNIIVVDVEVEQGEGSTATTVTETTDLSTATLTGVDSIALGSLPDTSGTVKLSVEQIEDIGQANIALAHPGLTGTVIVADLGSDPLDTSAFGDGVLTLPGIGIETAPGAVELDPATDLSNVVSMDISGTQLTMTGAQAIQLIESLVSTGITDPAALFVGDATSSLSFTDVDQDVIDFDITFAGTEYSFTQVLEAINANGWAGEVTIEGDVDIPATTSDLALGFDFNVGDGLTLGLGSPNQANGLVVNGTGDSTLQLNFGDSDPAIVLDASGYNVSTVRMPNTLTDGRNIDSIVVGLPEGVEKEIFNYLIDQVDQTVTISQGAIIGGFALDILDPNIELEDITLNLAGGVLMEGGISLATTPAPDGVIQLFLESLTINSYGTEPNPLTDETANIIDSFIIPGPRTVPPVGTAPAPIANSLLDVFIDATQELQITGGIVFQSGDPARNDDEAANVTVTGDAPVFIGKLDVSSDAVDALNVVNNGTGMVTVGIAEDGDLDSYSFTGTGPITIVPMGLGNDLTDDVLDAVVGVILAGPTDLTTPGLSPLVTDDLIITADQFVAIGEANFLSGNPATNSDNDGGFLQVVGYSGQLFDLNLVDNDIEVGVITAAGDITLPTATDLTGVFQFGLGANSNVTMSAEQVLQVSSALAGLQFTAGAGASLNVTGVTQALLDVDVDGTAGSDLEATLRAMGTALAVSAPNIGVSSVEIVEDVSLASSLVEEFTNASGFQLIGTDIRIDIDMDLMTQVIGSNPDVGIRSTGVSSYVVTENSGDWTEVTIYVCNDTIGLETLGIQGNGDLDVTFDGIKRGVDFVMEGDGVADWDELEKELTDPDTVNIGGLTAIFYTPGNPGTVVNINNQGVELGEASDGGERFFNVGRILVANTEALTVNVTEGDAVIAAIAGTTEVAPRGTPPSVVAPAAEDQLVDLVITGTEDVTVTAAFSTLDTLDATGVNGLFTAEIADAVLEVTTGPDADLTVTNLVTMTGSSFDGTAGILNLFVTGGGASDLSASVFAGVNTVSIAEGTDLTLNIGQINDLGEENIFSTTPGVTGGDETLNIVDMDGSLFVAADLGADVILGTVMMAAGSWTLDPGTSLAGAAVMVPAGGELTLTADQYMELADLDGTAPGSVINITNLTQAHLDAGFDISTISDATGTVTLDAGETEFTFLGDDGLMLVAPDTMWNPNFSVEMSDGQILNLPNSTIASGLDINGTGDTTVVFQFLTLDGTTQEQIDASGYDVSRLEAIDRFFFGGPNNGNPNAEFVISGLSGDVDLVVYNDPNLLGIDGYDRRVFIEEDSVVPGEFVFNDISGVRELLTLTVTFEGDAMIDGDLRIPTTFDLPTGNDPQPAFLTSVALVSTEGADSTVNTIDGDVTGLPAVPATPDNGTNVEFENTLDTVTISGNEDFIITGKVIFSSPITGATTTATLDVTNSGTTTITGGIDSTDAEITGVAVSNTGGGTLVLTVDAACIDDTDALAFTGADIQLNIVGDVDLSDDDISGVSQITLDDGSTLTLTQAQYNILTAAGLLIADGDTADINIVEFDPAIEFDATLLADGINVDTIVVNSDNAFNGMTNLTGVDQILTPEGNDVTLTGAQYNQLDGGSPKILGVDDPNVDTSGDGNFTNDAPFFTLNITDIMQSDIDDGFDIGTVEGTNSNDRVLTFADPTGNVDDPLTPSFDESLGIFFDDATTVLGDTSEVTIDLAPGQSVGFANVGQISPVTTGLSAEGIGITVTGDATTAIVFNFANRLAGNETIDASGLNAGTLHLLNTFIFNRDVEALQNLSGGVIVRVYDTDAEVPGGVAGFTRTIIIEEEVNVPGFLVFNDFQQDREVTAVDLTLSGGSSITGPSTGPLTGTAINLSTVDALPLIASNLEMLTIRSVGAMTNTITGNIDPRANAALVVGGNASITNSLQEVMIFADADLVINGNIILQSLGTDGTDDTGTLTFNGTANVTLTQIDSSDPTGDGIGTVEINNNLVGGVLTITGASPSLLDNSQTEGLVINGAGTTVFGTLGEALNSDSISVVDASASTGDLDLGVALNIDSQNFAMTSGTGVTLMVVQDPVLDATGPTDTGWSFDFSLAAAGSELRFGDPLAGGLLYTPADEGALNINLGPNATLFIDQSMNLTDMDLTITQGNDIVLKDGEVLTLTAAQASGLRIVAGPDIGGDGITAVVNIIEMGDIPYDFSGIAADIAGTITLEDDDVTVDPTTDLGDFSVTLDANAVGDISAGQTIRFNTRDQAERDVIVVGPGTNESQLENSANVVWLFSDDLSADGPIDTSGYFSLVAPIYQVGRLWMNQTLIANNGGDIEQLFTTLPNTTLRVDFAGLDDLNVLLAATGFDRILEVASFADLVDLTFSDVAIQAFIQSLTIRLGGEVTIGEIAIGNMFVDPMVVDVSDIDFTELTIDSRTALQTGDLLAPEGFVNDNDGTNEVGENVQPASMNTIGDITTTGANIDLELLTVNILTGLVSVYGDSSAGQGAALMGGSIVFASNGEDDFVPPLVNPANPLSSIATLNFDGDNDAMFTSVDVSDPELTTLVVNLTGAGNFTAAGASPGAAVANTEVFQVVHNGTGVATFGTADEDDKPGVSGADLSLIDIDGSGDVVLNVIGEIDGAPPVAPATTSFLFDAANHTGMVTATLGNPTVFPTLQDGGVWEFTDGGTGNGDFVLTWTDNAILGAGQVTINNIDVIIDGDVDFTTLTTDDPATVADEEGLILLGDTNFFVPTGSSVTMLAEDADGVTFTGGGNVFIMGGQFVPAGDYGNAMTDVDDTGSVFLMIDTADGADGTPIDGMPLDIDITGSILGVAQVTVTGDGSVDATGAILDAADRPDAPTSFVVEVDASLTITPDQASRDLGVPDPAPRSVTGAGTTNITDISVGTPPIDFTGVVSAFVNIAVDADTFLDSDDNLGPAGAGRVTTIADGASLTAPGTVVDGQFINGPAIDPQVQTAASLVLIDENDMTPVSGDLSNVTVETITFVPGAVTGTITYPELYGDPALKYVDLAVWPLVEGPAPFEQVQTVVFLDGNQASGQVVNGGNAGAFGEVVIEDLSALNNPMLPALPTEQPIDLTTIDAGVLNAFVPFDLELNPASDLGDFSVRIQNGSMFTLEAAQATARVITDDDPLAPGSVVVTELEETLDADLSLVDVDSETALLDANGSPVLTANLGSGFEVLVSDSDPLTTMNNVVDFQGGLMESLTIFRIQSDNTELVFDADQANGLRVREQPQDPLNPNNPVNTAVTVNGIDGDPIDLSDIEADVLTANVSPSGVIDPDTGLNNTTLDPTTDLGEFTVNLEEGVQLTLSNTQFRDAGPTPPGGLALGDFTGTPGGDEELIVVTDWLPAQLVNTSVLLDQGAGVIAAVLQVRAAGPAVETVNVNSDLTGVEEIVIPVGKTLNMSADQFQQIQTSATVTGGGTLNLYGFDQDNADIDLSTVEALAGTITIDDSQIRLFALDAELTDGNLTLTIDGNAFAVPFNTDSETTFGDLKDAIEASGDYIATVDGFTITVRPTAPDTDIAVDVDLATNDTVANGIAVTTSRPGQTITVAGELRPENPASVIILDPAAIIDNATGDKFEIILQRNTQAITLSSEPQADGRVITDNSPGGTGRLVIGYDTQDPVNNPDGVLDASGYGMSRLYVINTLIKTLFDVSAPDAVPFEEYFDDLPGAPALQVVIYDADDALDAGLVNPDAVAFITRFVRVEPNTQVNASIAFNDIDPETEIGNLEIVLRGNSVINGSIEIPQDEDPSGQLPGKIVTLLQTLTITSNLAAGVTGDTVNDPAALTPVDGEVTAVTPTLIDGDGANPESTEIVIPDLLEGETVTIGAYVYTAPAAQTGEDAAIAIVADLAQFAADEAAALPGTWTAFALSNTGATLEISNSVNGNVAESYDPVTEVETVELTTIEIPALSAGDEFVIDGVSYIAPVDQSAVEVADAIVLAGGLPTPAGWTAVALSNTGATLQIANTVAGNQTDYEPATSLTLAVAPNQILGNIVASDLPGGGESTVETFTLALDPATSLAAGEQLQFNGQVVDLPAGGNADALGLALAAAGYANWRADYVLGSNVVTFTHLTAGNAVDVTEADFVFTDNGGTVGLPFAPGSVTITQGVFQNQENNLFNVLIEASHNLNIAGTLELSYVSGSQFIDPTFDDLTVEGTITINGNANVNIGQVDISDIHVTDVDVNHTGTGVVTAPGTSPGFNASNTNSLAFNTNGTINLGDADSAGVDGGADRTLSLIEINTTNAFNGDVNLGRVINVNPLDFTVQVHPTAGADSNGTVTMAESELAAGGVWQFYGLTRGIEEPDTELNNLQLTLDGDTLTLGAGEIILEDVNLIVNGALDLSEVTLTIIGDVTIEIPAGETLTLSYDAASGLDIFGEGTLVLVSPENDLNNYRGLQVETIDMSTTGSGTPVTNVDPTLDPETGMPPFFDIEMDVRETGAMGDLLEPATRTVIGSNYRDDIRTGGGDDTVIGGAGADRIRTDGGNDRIVADDLDIINGGGGMMDVVVFEAAVDAANLENDDLVNVELIVIENAGNATYDFSAQSDGFDEILGNTGNDYLIGSGVPMAGGNGDSINGGNGDDTLNGGNTVQEFAVGRDTLEGGDGADVFEFFVNTSQAAELVEVLVNPGVDRERIGIDPETIITGDEEIEINYTVGGTMGMVTITTADATFTDGNSIRDAIIDAFALVPNISAEAVTATAGNVSEVRLTAALNSDGVALPLTIGAINLSGTTDTLAVTEVADQPFDDEEAEWTVTVDGTPTPGDKYRLSTDPGVSVEVVATTNVDDDVANLLDTDFNTASTNVTSVRVDNVLTLTANNADNGGFNVEGTSTAVFSGSGASNIGATDYQTADIVVDFLSGTDKVSFGVAPTDFFNGGDFATYAAAKSAADGADRQFYFANVADLNGAAGTGQIEGEEGAGVLFADLNGDDTVDAAILLLGVTSMTVADIIG